MLNNLLDTYNVNMKTVLILFFLLKINDSFQFETMKLDVRLEHCLWNSSMVNSPYEKFFRNQIAEEYARLQIVTGLTQYHLTIFGNYNLTPTNNYNYNAFLICSWSTYGYLRNGQIIYDSIEMALKEALVREVGATGPGTQLSKLQAKNIINQCKDISAPYIGLKIVYIQNCIHTQIGYLSSLVN